MNAFVAIASGSGNQDTKFGTWLFTRVATGLLSEYCKLNKLVERLKGLTSTLNLDQSDENECLLLNLADLEDIQLTDE